MSVLWAALSLTNTDIASGERISSLSLALRVCVCVFRTLAVTQWRGCPKPPLLATMRVSPPPLLATMRVSPPPLLATMKVSPPPLLATMRVSPPPLLATMKADHNRLPVMRCVCVCVFVLLSCEYQGGGIEEKLPCESCGQLFPFSTLHRHQV